ncbi:MAG TPA: M1 family metallopeptidase [Bryobacteraceae bacterium]|nr:M1 family metallopeptidase [Bryobacteraceae bacterium]
MRLFVLFVTCSLAAALAAPTLEPPKLRLPDNVQPIRYAVDLTIVPDRDTFRGAVDISIDIRTATPVIWLNASDLQIQEASFRPASGAPTKAEVLDGGKDFAGFSFDHPVSGKGILHVAYQGKISRNSSAGLFQMKEADQWYVYSQFEPTDARRAFPCFDEPGFKVPWQLTLHVPKNDVAVANSPEVSHAAEPDGMQAVRFKESKPLPSYLVALAVGRFDIVNAGKLGKTPLRIITPRGKGVNAKYAAESIPELLKLLEDYFGIPYPYEKLDSIVMPISNFAMENAGLITYGETLLLSKPEDDTIHRQRECAIVTAHEMAHQWFGDLVTTAWWDDIWLNEAFASWMENKIVGEWKPEWHIDVTVVNDRLFAMGEDSLISTRKIRQPIESNDDIANAFDGITYQKGEAVIQMFESWIGKEKFRKGIQLYLKQHAWGAATAKDFEAGISTAAGHDIAPAFDTFLNQAGFPEISVTLDCTAKPALELSQKRLLPIGSQGSGKQSWLIPICVSYESGSAKHRQCELLSDPRSRMVLASAKTCPVWLEPNDGENGYYQVNYKNGLLDQVLAGHGAHLSVAERVGVLGNVESLMNSGDLSPRAALALVSEFSQDPNREIVSKVMDIAGVLRTSAVPEELREKGARFIREVFGKRALQLGWTAKPDETQDTRLLREQLVPFVASLGEQRELIAGAEPLARKWLSDRSGIDPDMISPVLRVAAEFGTSDLFGRLYEAAAKEQNQHQRELIIGALGAFRNPEIVRRAMALMLTKEFDARESFFALLFGPRAYPETRELPFQFVEQNIDKLLAVIPREVGEDYAAYLPFVGGGFCDASHRDAIQKFFADRVKSFTGGPRNLAQTLEQIDLCIAKRKAMGPELGAVLQGY